MTLREFQQLIRAMYHDKDASRGVEGTFMWLTEEIGDLATALRSGTQEERSLEFADVLAWLGDDAPVVQAGDMDLIAQPLDFMGVNYYTRNFSCASQTWDAAKPGNPLTEMGWEIYPPGLTELLCRLHKDYTLPAVYITENGGAFKDPVVDGRIDDRDRLAYLHDHMQATLHARQQGVDVRGYFVWSLMDNFEWASGYQKRFGIVHVDYATQHRTLKQSALWYQSLLKG